MCDTSEFGTLASFRILYLSGYTAYIATAWRSRCIYRVNPKPHGGADACIQRRVERVEGIYLHEKIIFNPSACCLLQMTASSIPTCLQICLHFLSKVCAMQEQPKRPLGHYNYLHQQTHHPAIDAIKSSAFQLPTYDVTRNTSISSAWNL